jgi:chitodextrinase
LTWTDPEDADFDHVEITWTPGGGSGTVLKGAGTKTVTGLTNNTLYTFTVKAADNAGNKSAGVTGTATPADTTPPANVTGLSAVPDYQQVTLTWTGPGDADFDHVEITWTPNGSTPVTVTAGTQTKTVTGLTSNTLYTFTVKAVDNTGNKSAGVTGTATPTDTLNSIATVAAYLADAPGGAAAGNPVPLPVGVQLSAAGWAGLLGAVQAADKFVALDLSACPKGTGSSGGGLYADGTFDPYQTDTDAGRIAAKGKIVSLVLPDAASGIAGSYGGAAFRCFDALREIEGANVTTIGVFAFLDCSALTTADFPVAATIGNYAFRGCVSLATLSLPAVPPVLAGTGVFYGTNLGAGAGTTLTILVPDAAAVSAYVTAWGVAADTAANGHTGKYGSDHKRIVITP